ncbi:hypothetical protein CR513_41840, partial [Mucuna pruriens]
MGEKEIIVNTPFPMEYIEEDEEALETSFQVLEIVGTTNIETGRGDIKPSKAMIMATKVLITNGFEPGKGLGRRLDGMANPLQYKKIQGEPDSIIVRSQGKQSRGERSKASNRQGLWGHRDSRTRSNGRRSTDRAGRVDVPHGARVGELDCQSIARTGLLENSRV